MHPAFNSSAHGQPTAQDLASQLWNHITNERAALVNENEALKVENATLKAEVKSLRSSKDKKGAVRSSNVRGGVKIKALVRQSSIALPTIPVQPSAAGVPNEVLLEIFGHLHAAYNFQNRSNALLGNLDPPTDLKAWNPAGLQLVCRRWRDLARPQFYQEQIAVDCRKPTTLLRLTRTLNGDKDIPYPQMIVLILTAETSLDSLIKLSIMSRSYAKRHPSRGPVGLLASTPGWHSLFDLYDQFPEITIAPRDDSPSDWEFDSPFTFVFEHLERDFLNALDEDPLIPSMLTLRWKDPHNVQRGLEEILATFARVPKLAHLRLDLPSPLPSSVLDAASPTLAGILQQPSHAVGRYLLARNGTVKRISFGTHSVADASALRARIDALGELAVVVDVDVLDV